jgi:hypothetical protein
MMNDNDEGVDGVDDECFGEDWFVEHVEPVGSLAAENERLRKVAETQMAALVYAQELVKVARRRFPKSVKHRDTFTLLNADAAISKAIHEATAAGVGGAARAGSGPQLRTQVHQEEQA